MTLDQIKQSGLLELYALGETTAVESRIVVDALKEYPELKDELRQIEKAFEQYAHVNSVPAPNVLSNVLQTINTNGSSSSSSTSWWKWLSLLFMAASSFLGYKYIEHKEALMTSEQALKECEEQQSALNTNMALYQQIYDPTNDIVIVEPTEKYPETKLAIYVNDDSQRNYLQMANLPDLGADQSFQLWSLKADSDPIPLDVFQGDEGEFLSVQFIDATAAYAITIEPKGGSTSPTLDNLIGVFSLKS